MINTAFMSPKEQNYSMPAEWEEHECCWMQWPHDNQDFDGYGSVPNRATSVKLQFCHQDMK